MPMVISIDSEKNDYNDLPVVCFMSHGLLGVQSGVSIAKAQALCSIKAE